MVAVGSAALVAKAAPQPQAKLVANDILQDFQHIVQDFNNLFPAQRAAAAAAADGTALVHLNTERAAAAATTDGTALVHLNTERAAAAATADGTALVHLNTGTAVRDLIHDLGDLKHDISQHDGDGSPQPMLATLARMIGGGDNIRDLTHDIQGLIQDLGHLDLDGGGAPRALLTMGGGMVGRISDIPSDFSDFQLDFIGIFNPPQLYMML